MQLPAAVSPLTREVVMGSPRRAAVLATYPTVVYLRVEGVAVPARVALPVVTADALLLPTALRLGVRSGQVAWPWAVGDTVTVGGGRVEGAGLSVQVAREWHPARVSSGLAQPAVSGIEVLPDGGALGDRSGEVVAAALAGQPDEVARLVGGLVGSGPGLTPSGDDALCGLLLAMRAWAGSPSPAGIVADAVGRVWHRTTDLSASLLAAAVDGYAVPEVVALVDALASSGEGHGADEAVIRSRLERVLAMGHTSGSDLVAGLSATLRILTTLDPLPPPFDRECTSSDRECTSFDRECTSTPEGTTRA